MMGPEEVPVRRSMGCAFMVASVGWSRGPHPPPPLGRQRCSASSLSSFRRGRRKLKEKGGDGEGRKVVAGRRRRSAVVCRGTPGVRGLSEVQGWKGFDNEDLKSGKLTDVDPGALRRHLNRGLSDREEDAVEAVFEYLVRAGRSHKEKPLPFELSYGEVHDIIRDCMRVGMWTAGVAALRFLEAFHAPARLSTYAIAAGGLANANRVFLLRDLVFKLLRTEERRHGERRAHPVRNVDGEDEEHTDGQNHQKPPPLPPMLLETPVPDERICALAANVAVENNRLSVAVEIAEEMTKFGIKLGPLTHSILIKGYGRRRLTGDVKRQLLKMKQDGVQGDLILYNTAIDAFVRGGMLKLAEKVITRMQEKGLHPDRVSYNTLLKGLTKARRLREAFRLKKQMEATGISTDDVTRNSLIDGCMQAKRYDDALRLLDEVVSIEPTTAVDEQIAYTTIVAGLAKAGDLAAAADFMEQMRENDVTPNVVTFTSIISGALSRGDVNRALSTFKDMELNGIAADQGTFKAMIAGLCARGGEEKIEAAQKLLATMKNRGIETDIGTYNMLIHGYVRAGLMREAERMLTSLQRVGLSPDVVTYTTMLKGYGRERNIREVRRIFQDMKSAGIEPDIYALNTFISSCVRSGELNLAYRLFQELKRNRQNPDVYTYTTIISGLVKVGRVSESWQLYREMKQRGVVPTGWVVDTLMKCVDAMSLDSLGLREAKTLVEDARAIGLEQSKIREYESMVENLRFMTSETWKESPDLFGRDSGSEKGSYGSRRRGGGRDGDGDDDDDDDDDDYSASESIFREHDWNEIDSSFRFFI